jgi:hypothetical protein
VPNEKETTPHVPQDVKSILNAAPAALKTLWLQLYLKELLEIAALQELLQNAIENKKKLQKTALTDAIFKKMVASKEYFYFVKNTGHMLYAFPETTALEQGGAL